MKIQKMRFGSVETTKITDENGSTEHSVVKFHNGVPGLPVTIRYTVVERVTSQAQELEAYKKFSDELIKDKSMLDPSFKKEHTRNGDDAGYYHVIKSYTRLATHV